MKGQIKAVLFDMDGVLVEAKDWHYEAFNKALGERQKFCVHGIIGARQTGASNEHEHQTQFS